MYFSTVAGFIACKVASPFDAVSCPPTPSSTFYKLREIERQMLALRCAKYNGTCDQVLTRSQHQKADA